MRYPDERVEDFCVVVPFFNEAHGMRATLDALAAQSDLAFTLVLVDNGSTDDSVRVSCAWSGQASGRQEFSYR